MFFTSINRLVVRLVRGILVIQLLIATGIGVAFANRGGFGFRAIYSLFGS